MQDQQSTPIGSSSPRYAPLPASQEPFNWGCCGLMLEPTQHTKICMAAEIPAPVLHKTATPLSSNTIMIWAVFTVAAESISNFSEPWRFVT